jgi:hypothetical protein
VPSRSLVLKPAKKTKNKVWYKYKRGQQQPVHTLLLVENQALKAQLDLLKVIQLVKPTVAATEHSSGARIIKGQHPLAVVVPFTADAPSATILESLAIVPFQSQLPLSSNRLQDTSLSSPKVHSNGAAAVGASVNSQAGAKNGVAPVGKISSLSFPLSPLVDIDVHNLLSQWGLSITNDKRADNSIEDFKNIDFA